MTNAGRTLCLRAFVLLHIACTNNILLHDLKIELLRIRAPVRPVKDNHKIQLWHDKNILSSKSPREVTVDSFSLPRELFRPPEISITESRRQADLWGRGFFYPLRRH